MSDGTTAATITPRTAATAPRTVRVRQTLLITTSPRWARLSSMRPRRETPRHRAVAGELSPAVTAATRSLFPRMDEPGAKRMPPSGRRGEEEDELRPDDGLHDLERRHRLERLSRAVEWVLAADQPPPSEAGIVPRQEGERAMEVGELVTPAAEHGGGAPVQVPMRVDRGGARVRG